MNLQTATNHGEARANHAAQASPRAVILAGGEGLRLRALTRALSGDDRPKQFCVLTGGDTLLQQTQRRIATLIPPERTTIVITHGHEKYLAPSIAKSGAAILTQPCNRGTAPAILYSLLRLASEATGEEATTPVALFPADHYFENDAVFVHHVGRALGAIRQRPHLIILLGIVPHGPEADYGWIVPGNAVSGVLNGSLCLVRSFHEKPGPGAARELMACGCLWNSFVIVSSAQALRNLMHWATPDLVGAFSCAAAAAGGLNEAALDALYAELEPTDFSRQVLARSPEFLTVLPAANTGWVDVGRPERALALPGRAVA
ncbi:MAG TPA: sugar phosphate nucleotidyltransferase [Bryobacteraceae bacterium]|nr:sugar phosphate nucleotidyltransferase [Bryobacteraceae bacterium]